MRHGLLSRTIYGLEGLTMISEKELLEGYSAKANPQLLGIRDL